MEQKDLRELLLSLAAEASASYESTLRERNSKFEEIQMINKRIEELKVDPDESFFSPRNSLSKYDTKLNLVKDLEKERLELDRLDSLCDSFLNRKEELIGAVELFDELCDDIDRQRKTVEELQQSLIDSKNETVALENAAKSNAAKETTDAETPASDNATGVKDSSEEAKPSFDEQKEDPLANVDKKTLEDVIAYIAYRTEDIAKYVLLDPGRARNELLALHSKIEF